MARIHARRRGKSQSKKPLSTSPPTWVAYKPKEIEEIIVKLAKQGNQSSKIGLILRDSYGIPDVRTITGKKICKMLNENKVASELPEDILNLIRRANAAAKHLDRNKKDMVTKRGLHLIESKIHRLIKYYQSRGRVPREWRYTRESAKLISD